MDRASTQATSVAKPTSMSNLFRRTPCNDNAIAGFDESAQRYTTPRFFPLRCAKWYHATSTEESVMLRYAIIFLIIAIIAAVLGFSGIAGAAGSIAYILAIVFVILFIASLIFGRRVRL